MKTQILDIIIDAITSERINWNRTWSSTQAQNFHSKTIYRGYNSYLNFVSRYFLTYKQVIELKGNVKKGAKGYPVVYALWGEDATKQNQSNQSNPNDRKFLGHRYYTVFAEEDIEGIKFPDNSQDKNITPLQSLTSYLQRENIQIKYGEPAYNITRDYISFPTPNDFNSQDDYNAVLAHECTHSTGIEKRTNRFQKHNLTDHKFGSSQYAKEELVAELGAILLTGNRVSKNSIAYIQSWIQALKASNQKQEIIDAFQLAQKAFDYIMNTHTETKES